MRAIRRAEAEPAVLAAAAHLLALGRTGTGLVVPMHQARA